MAPPPLPAFLPEIIIRNDQRTLKGEIGGVDRKAGKR
jgi:hypothetical protein